MAESSTANQAQPSTSGRRTSNRSLRRLQGRAQFTTVMAAGRLAQWFVRGEKPEVDRNVVLETWDARVIYRRPRRGWKCASRR